MGQKYAKVLPEAKTIHASAHSARVDSYAGPYVDDVPFSYSAGISRSQTVAHDQALDSPDITQGSPGDPFPWG